MLGGWATPPRHRSLPRAFCAGPEAFHHFKREDRGGRAAAAAAVLSVAPTSRRGRGGLRGAALAPTGTPGP